MPWISMVAIRGWFCLANSIEMNFLRIFPGFLIFFLVEGSVNVLRFIFPLYTVPTHNKHIHNKHIVHNKHTLFVLTKMCLFWEEEDFGKINSL